MLPKIDNTELEKQGAQVIAQNNELLNVIKEMNKTAYQQLLFLTQIERVSRHTADNMLNTTLAINKMLPYVAQAADNIYNIAARIAGNQVTSMKETVEAIGEQQVAMYKKTLGGFTLDDLKGLKEKPKAEDEGAKIEAEREKAREGKGVPERKETKQKSFLERLGEIFEKILIPLVFGFVVGLSKALGGFESTIGKVITIFAALYLALSGFRKKVNELVVSGFKKLLGGSKPPVPAGGGPAQVPGKAPVPGAPSAPGTPGTPDMKGGKPGPSGLDKFLQNAQKVGKSIKDLFVGIADTIKQVLGKLSEGIKQFITKVSEGIKSLLQNIAKGIESFGKTSVLKGAAALVVVSGALFIAAKAFKEFADVQWESVAKGVIGIAGLALTMKLLEKGTMSMIKGAAALTIMSGALFVAGKAFQQFADVDWKTLAVAAVGIAGLTGALMLLGPLIVPITIGAGALTVMSLALAGFGAAVEVLAAGLPTVTEFIKQIASIDGVALLSAAGGITAIGVALAALGAGQVVQALGNFASSILSFGEKDIFTKLTELGQVAGDLNQLPATIESLGKLSNFKVSNDFMKNVDTLSAGLKKIAESAKGFEKTGDSLTALAKIAEVMNKPAGGGAPAGAQPGAAPGKPPAAAPGRQAAGQPPAAAPGRQAGGAVQAAPQVYSKEEIATAERNLAAAEKSGGKAAVSAARSRLENMKSQNKIAASTAQATPEQRQAVATGKPVPVPANQGQRITTDSQKVEAAKGSSGGGGGQTNIVAPQSSVVNAPQSQTVNAPLSAYGIFGGKASAPQQKSAAF